MLGLNCPQTPNPQMGCQISRRAALHALIISGAYETGETLAAIFHRFINHGPKFGFQRDTGLVTVKRDGPLFHSGVSGVSRLWASSLACIFLARAARLSFSDFFNPCRARFSAAFLFFSARLRDLRALPNFMTLSLLNLPRRDHEFWTHDLVEFRFGHKAKRDRFFT